MCYGSSKKEVVILVSEMKEGCMQELVFLLGIVLGDSFFRYLDMGDKKVVYLISYARAQRWEMVAHQKSSPAYKDTVGREARQESWFGVRA